MVSCRQGRLLNCSFLQLILQARLAVEISLYTPSTPTEFLNPRFFSEGIQLHPAPRKTGRKKKKDRQRGRLKKKKREKNQWQSNWGGTKLDSAAPFLCSALRFVFSWSDKSVKDCLGVYFTWTHHINLPNTLKDVLFLYLFFSVLSLFPYFCSPLSLLAASH